MIDNEIQITNNNREKNLSQTFNEEKRTLQDRLKEIELSEENRKEIIENETRSSTRKFLVDMIPNFGKSINTVLDCNSNINKKITEAKEKILIDLYFQKTDFLEAGFEKLSNLVTNPHGNILFNKVLRILDDSMPDSIYINQLSSALKFISETDFERLFNDHHYALGLIERLTPQALLLLSNLKELPTIPRGLQEGIERTRDRLIKQYIQDRGIIDEDIIYKVEHSLKQLIIDGLIDAKISDNEWKLEVTLAGSVVIPYIKR